MATITHIDNQQLAALTTQSSTHATFIDIREPDEFAREHIAGSINVPAAKLTQFDFCALPTDILVFLCAAGNRTKSAQQAIEQCGKQQIFCLQGGLAQWKQCGHATVVDRKAPLPIIRQVHITAGLLIITGIILSHVVHPQFVYLSAFVGCGLLFAGMTGWCGMAKLLQHLPYNRSVQHE